MPLIHSASKEAVSRNIKTEMEEGHKPQKQAIAIALDIARRAKRATGGHVNLMPTDAQKHAGNYKKHHVLWNGLDISIETPKGSTRSGVDKNGKSWSVRMPADYGYIKRTEGADGDHVDVYLGPDRKSDKVFIVDQRDHASKEFDEHKVMLGYADARAAEAAYCQAFSDGKGRARIGSIVPMSLDAFKAWLRGNGARKPAGHFPRGYSTGGPVHVGPIHSAVGGRTDHLAMQVPSGSYVIPADVVSGMGQGNTSNGLKILGRMFPVKHRASGGKNVPIMAAGGEFVIDPEAVTRLGGGDMDRGHQILDRWVVKARKNIVDTMKKLPGPAR